MLCSIWLKLCHRIFMIFFLFSRKTIASNCIYMTWIFAITWPYQFGASPTYSNDFRRCTAYTLHIENSKTNKNNNAINYGHLKKYAHIHVIHWTDDIINCMCARIGQVLHMHHCSKKKIVIHLLCFEDEISTD